MTMPRGGFTDVGLHTGGTPRATSWDLVQQTLLAVLQQSGVCSADQQPDAILALALAHLDLWLLSQQLQLLRPETATADMLNVCMSMLDSAARKAAALAMDGHNVSSFEAQLQIAAQRIQVATAERAVQEGNQYMLPASSSDQGPGRSGMSGTWRLPSGVVPAAAVPEALATGRHAAVANATAALGALPVTTTGSTDTGAAATAGLGHKLQQLQGLLQALNQHSGDVAAQHAISSVEEVMFGCAVAGFDNASSRLQSAADAEALMQLIALYRNMVSMYRQSTAAAATMKIEVRSREALLTWVAYCMMFELAKSQEPLVRSYNVALSWRDPQYFVLCDKTAVEATLSVSSYLYEHSSPSRHQLFSMSDSGKGTAAFAVQFVAQDSRLSGILRQHQLDMDLSVEKHDAEVQRKKQLFAQLTAEASELTSQISTLRGQLRPLEAEQADLNRQASSLSRRLWELRFAVNADKLVEKELLEPQYALVQSQKSAVDKKVSPLQSRKNTLESKLADVNRQLQAAREAPASVIQPLPKNTQNAHQWVFWLHKPTVLSSLADISLLAQQLLLPTPCSSDVQSAIQVTDMVTSIVQHYNTHQVSRYHRPVQLFTGSQGLVKPFARAGVPGPSTIGPRYVDQITSKEQGVWYPDDLLPVMTWNGACTAADNSNGFPPTFNPFAAIDTTITADSFTERLPAQHASLQWTMLQLGSRAATPLDRGNLGIARQDQKPCWMSKPGYLAFTSMRAYPLMQLRQLCIALREQHLPWGHPAVVALVKQTVYQLGDLIWTNDSSTSSSSTGSMQLLWRRHWEAEGQELHALSYELQLLAEKLADAPREHDAVLLLGQLAAYLADWHSGCKEAARQFAAMTSKAAEQLGKQLQQARAHNQDGIARQLQAKQSKARALSLLCYGAGPLDASDVAHMLQLMVLVKHGDLLLADTALADELQQLRVQCHWVMVKRLPAVLAVLQQGSGISRRHAVEGPAGLAGSPLMTAAVAAVLQWTPPELQWVQLTTAAGHAWAGFHAEGSDGHLYSLNILDGTVLLDGVPPSRLPSDILQHPVYHCCFGSSNFDVGFTATGMYKTLRAIDGCYYSFYWAAASSTSQHGSTGSGRELVILETERDTGEQLQLLDVGVDGACGAWGRELPLRLRQLHSHWLNRQHKVIVLRPKHFQQHSVSFLIRYGVSDRIGGQSPPAAASSASAEPPVQATALWCWRVPHHLTSEHWLSLLSNYAHQLQTQPMVLADSSEHLRILGKFEDAAYIHVYASDKALSAPSAGSAEAQGAHVAARSVSTNLVTVPELLFELPRFGLEFELRGGCLLSKAHSGYCLSKYQQLVGQVPPRDSAGPVCAPAGAEMEGNSGSTSSSGGSSISSAVHYTLPGFRQYLVLEPVQEGSSDAPRPADGYGSKMVLVPAGQVVQTGSSSSGGIPWAGTASVAAPKHASATLLVHKYAVHPRFGHLRASDVLPRLQLAALYAATSSLMPEPGSMMTGAQTAVQLIRQSWVNRPLSPEEVQHLETAAACAGHLAPALRLLVVELQGSASQLQHLYDLAGAGGEDSGTTSSSKSVVIKPEAAVEYRLQAMKVLPGGWPLHRKLRLSSDVEVQVMGASSTAAASSMPAWKRLGQFHAIDASVPRCPVSPAYVEECEARLRNLVTATHTRSALKRSHSWLGLKRRQPDNSKCGSGGISMPEYPLTPNKSSSTPLESMMHAELQQSWEAHHSTSTPTAIAPIAATVISSMQVNVSKKRQEIQGYLAHHISYTSQAAGAPAAAFRLLQLSSSVASASLLDLMCCAWQPHMLPELNPFLSGSACSRLHEGVLVWLQLCVLEDKLARLGQHVRAGAAAASLLVQELLVYRKWDVAQHPKWLVFEVEGQLQIRPAQYDIAEHLITHPGAIMQLNMGEGKTRVILPMLALHWAGSKKHVVRLNFLSTLLHEAYSHLHQHLSASVLGVKLLLMPFHRDVTLTPQTARAMRAAVSRCQKVGGLLLVVPEHRLSLQLKWHELRMKGDAASLAVCEELQALANMPYCDMLDESDEILHHRSVLA
eukprot:GHUV01006249.1.p1 GENE.GHUV01006249.1~~GHUV01006249.1.p1  ORF type:complete len:2036 (+),score=737.34 GHUV01006249.1:1069-7176(+)